MRQLCRQTDASMGIAFRKFHRHISHGNGFNVAADISNKLQKLDIHKFKLTATCRFLPGTFHGTFVCTQMFLPMPNPASENMKPRKHSVPTLHHSVRIC